MLRIRMMSGEEVASMPVVDLSDVKTLKQQLNWLHGLPSRFRQRLFLCGNPLDDSASLDSPVELELVLLPLSAEAHVDKLLTASVNGSVCQVEAVLQRPQHPDVVDVDGSSPLLLASAYGHLEVVRLLLEASADTNFKNHGGLTGVMLASQGGHVEIMRLLLEECADKNLKDNDGVTATMMASAQGHIEALRLLLQAGVDKNSSQKDGVTAFMLASQQGHVNIVRLLLEAGADMNLANRVGHTALMLASRRGHIEVLHLLLEACADKNWQADDGVTATMMASCQGHIEALRLLVEAGAEKNMANNDGDTALFFRFSFWPPGSSSRAPGGRRGHEFGQQGWLHGRDISCSAGPRGSLAPACGGRLQQKQATQETASWHRDLWWYLKEAMLKTFMGEACKRLADHGMMQSSAKLLL
ncbi:unnamed protein product [Symbiodinium microadriaticum]|nr:unnamed protein product [Symbiodinium microadriaticum]